MDELSPRLRGESGRGVICHVQYGNVVRADLYVARAKHPSLSALAVARFEYQPYWRTIW
jgi:hypothetical protein